MTAYPSYSRSAWDSWLWNNFHSTPGSSPSPSWHISTIFYRHIPCYRTPSRPPHGKVWSREGTAYWLQKLWTSAEEKSILQRICHETPSWEHMELNTHTVARARLQTRLLTDILTLQAQSQILWQRGNLHTMPPGGWEHCTCSDEMPSPSANQCHIASAHASVCKTLPTHPQRTTKTSSKSSSATSVIGCYTTWEATHSHTMLSFINARLFTLTVRLLLGGLSASDTMSSSWHCDNKGSPSGRGRVVF